MLRLRALGGATLIREGVPLLGAASQSRRIALLTIIAAAGTQGVSRDTLIGLLWPDSPEDRARHALSQWLFLMRRDLGIDDLILGSHTLHLNRDRISADVFEFDNAIAAQRWTDAAQLYRGPLLEGMLLSNAPEFQLWLDREREQRYRQAKRAVEQLARATEDAADTTHAIGWWQRLAALDPHSGPTAAKVIRLLAAQGDAVAALAFARRHEQTLREALDLAPSAEVSSLIASLRAELQSRAAEAGTVERPIDDPYITFLRDRLAARYVVDALTARNSLTTAFTARRTADLTRTTLRIFLPDLVARTDRARLVSLLENAARLEHPHIASPDDVGMVDGIVFVASAAEDGPTLRQALASAPTLPVTTVLQAGAQLAGALAHAHTSGITHGNVTPRRVLLGGAGATLADVGVLPALKATATRMPHDSGFPTGNPSYMSPEQLMGDESTAAASDVYGLGCLLYQMLSGSPPHAGQSLRANIAARTRDPAPPIDNAAPRRPAALDAIVAAMLERSPADRPTAMEAARVLADLRIQP